MNAVNILFFLFFMLFVIKMSRLSNGLFIVMFLVLLGHIWLIAGTVFAETGVYLIDTYVYAYEIGSTLRLVALLASFWFGFSACLTLNKKRIRKLENSLSLPKKEVSYWVLALFTAMDIYLLIDVAISSEMFSIKAINRFNYYSIYSKLPFAFYVTYFMGSVQIINGFVFAYSRDRIKKQLSAIILILYIVQLLSIGHQSMFIFNAVFYFIMPFAIKNYVLLNKDGLDNSSVLLRKNKYKYLCILMLCLVTGFAFFNKYMFMLESGTYSEYVSGPFAAVLYRFLPLQANTWWNIDNLVYNYDFNDISQVFNEIESYFGLGNNLVGISFLMQKIMPMQFFDIYIEGNGTLNGGYPAFNIALLGYILSIFACFLEGGIFFSCCYFFYKYICNGNYVRLFFMSYIWMQVNKIYNIGGYSYVFNKGPIIAMIILLVINYVTKYNIKPTILTSIERR